jgi:hypothetical protein
MQLFQYMVQFLSILKFLSPQEECNILPAKGQSYFQEKCFSVQYISSS